MNRFACRAVFSVSVVVALVGAGGCTTVEPFAVHQDMARKLAAEDLGCKDPLVTTVSNTVDRGAGKDRMREANVVVEGCGQKATYGIQCTAEGNDGCTKMSQELPPTTPTSTDPPPVVQPGAVPNP